ncbi:MAG: DUF417 family protein [Caulobacteraceae bacterium]|nr:DUF417 family protein [Caulobacteraceae bacterium]
MEKDATVAAGRWPRVALAGDDRLASIGGWAITFALAIVFLWFGCLKFTAYEESGVAGFIMNSPLISWLHATFGIAGGAKFLGVFEILTGLLIAGRLISPRLSIIGGLMGLLTFFITLTLMLSTPGVIQPGFDGPFALSAVPGQFLLKDLISLAACLWVLGVSLAEARIRRRVA